MTVLLLATIVVNAQDRFIRGTVVDRDTQEPMMQTTVQLLKTDSTYVGGAITDRKDSSASRHRPLESIF